MPPFAIVLQSIPLCLAVDQCRRYGTKEHLRGRLSAMLFSGCFTKKEPIRREETKPQENRTFSVVLRFPVC